MPFYEFRVCFEMTETERQQLVDRVTQLHTRKFHTASFIVNIAFQDLRPAKGMLHVYRNGKPYLGNSIRGVLRSGDRTPTAFNAMTLALVQAWAEIINGGKTEDVPPERALMACSIEPTVAAAWEHGFLICEGGQDAVWLNVNRKAIEAAAEKGDEDMKFTLQEIDTRPDLAI